MEGKEKTESEASKKVWTAGEVREVEGGSFLHVIRAVCLSVCLYGTATVVSVEETHDDCKDFDRR